MKNKLILGLVIATLAFTAIGCGAKDTQAPDTQKESTETETTNDSQEDTSKNTSNEDTTTEDTSTETVPSEEESQETESDPAESESTPESEDTTGSLPFEGVYWYVEREGMDDPEFPIPAVKEGRYFDGTYAYYYYQYADAPEVYEYKYVEMESSDGEDIYHINLYRDGEQYDSDSIRMSNGKIFIVKDYGGFGGLYTFEPVDSLDGFYE